MVKKFRGKLSENPKSVNCFEMRTIQRKIQEFPGAKLNGFEISKFSFRKFWPFLRSCPLFWQFWENAIFSSAQVSSADNLASWAPETSYIC